MERESFENNEVAAILNKHFIPIKVDREERPDLDRIYMNYAEATTGHGGWPLNVFLTPDLGPIFGGTYFPGPGSTMALPGRSTFIDILQKLEELWRTQRQKCLESAKEVTDQLLEYAAEGNLSREGNTELDGLDLDLFEELYKQLAKTYDRRNGGFGKAPKFPTPFRLALLLKLAQYPSEVRDIVGEKETKHASDMVYKTLTKMNAGGIHDQLGGGFARYSVTVDWFLPHFEKMYAPFPNFQSSRKFSLTHPGSTTKPNSSPSTSTPTSPPKTQTFSTPSTTSPRT